jgi:hypothetical protein
LRAWKGNPDPERINRAQRLNRNHQNCLKTILLLTLPAEQCRSLAPDGRHRGGYRSYDPTPISAGPVAPTFAAIVSVRPAATPITATTARTRSTRGTRVNTHGFSHTARAVPHRHVNAGHAA